MSIVKTGLILHHVKHLETVFFRGSLAAHIFFNATVINVTRFGILFYQILFDAFRQHPLLFIIATSRTGVGAVRPDLNSFDNK